MSKIKQAIEVIEQQLKVPDWRKDYEQEDIDLRRSMIEALEEIYELTRPEAQRRADQEARDQGARMLFPGDDFAGEIG